MKIRKPLMIIFVMIISFFVIEYNKFLNLKEDYEDVSNYSISSALVFNTYLNDKSLYNKSNILIKDAKENFDREKYNQAVSYVSSISDDSMKNTLLERLERIDKIIKKYEDKINLIKSNPDRVASVTYIEKDYKVLEEVSGNITAFTPYCEGYCNGYTASGLFVGNNIFYKDKEFGLVRIVAGDSSYPFGTIIRIKNLDYFGEDVYAIVLDRGGAVGKGKWALFDLLFISENNANDFGVKRNIKCEILRLGY